MLDKLRNMLDKLGNIQSGIGMIGKTENRINNQKEATIQKIRETFLGVAKISKDFSEKGNLDEIPSLLEELKSAKEKVEGDLQKLLEQSKSQAGQAGQELQNLATNLGGNTDDTTKQQDDTTEQQDDTTEQQDDTTRLPTSSIEEKENFETNISKANKQKALEFLEKNITDQNTLESIKKKINEIKYTRRGIIIGPVQWEKICSGEAHQIASKSDFEQSFEWLFGENLPDSTKNTKGELEYPRDPRIAVIPFLLGWEKNGRYGQDSKWHNVGESGFYALKDGRVCKFDETGGTIRPKRDADGRIETTYITG